MKQAILWDLDGTLLYTLQDIANATNATLRAFHLPERSLEEVRSFVGNGAAQQMRRSAGGEPENFEEIMAFYRAYYPQHCNETTRRMTHSGNRFSIEGQQVAAGHCLQQAGRRHEVSVAGLFPRL